jgi:predicted membrane-bound spermidine synthase
MLGSAAGAAVLARSARNRLRPGAGRAWGFFLLAGFIPLAACVILQIRFGWFEGLAETAGFLAASGFLVAAVFSYASLLGSPEQETVISPLYAADLLGGCLGSLVASLILIPLYGMDTTAAAMAVLSFAAAVFL